MELEDLPPGSHPPSIGVLSPFRAQVDHLVDRLRERFPAGFFYHHKVMVGTAHTFQGEERDLMFLSFAIDPDSPAASRRFLEKEDVFNVAITRAKHRQHVFVSVGEEDLPAGSLLQDYLTSLKADMRPPEPTLDRTLDALDHFGNEVKDALESAGFDARLGYPLAGLRLDLIAISGDRHLGIDLIGCPGPSQPAFPLERYKMFHRANLRLMPLPFATWQIDRDACLEEIRKRLSTKHPERI